MAKMIFARQIDTGKIVGIDEVESGLKCNCVCPHCGDILEARKGKIRVHHFAHSGKGETAFCSETALHLAAKEILKEERKILLPRLKIDDDIYHSCFEIMPDGYEFIYDTVEVEKSIFVDNELIRPDLIVSKGNAVLAVEILVSHAVDEEKKEKIKRARLTTIEIELNADEIINKETLRNILVSKTSNKKWIFSKQRNYFAEKIPQICKKFIVKNKIVRDCPINIWQGRKLGASVGQCNGCKYGYGVSLEHVWCLGEKRIAKIDDLKLNVDKLQEHIKKQKMEEMEDDKEVFLRGICPVCHSRLRVGKADDPYISCRNFKVCKFTASIDLIKYTSCFKDREGNYTVVNLPEYVINDVLELQENANLELSKVENLFPKGICPWCGCSLVIRKGEYGAFLGCTGYADFGCNFKAKLDLGNSTATFQTRYSPKRTIVKPIPEDLVREYNSRKEVPKRIFLIREKDGRED